MVRKSSRNKSKAKKSKPASSSGTPSLNDRGRYQPQHKKATATGPSSAKAAKKSRKTVDAIRKATTKVAAKKPVALPPPSGNRRQSLRLAALASGKPAASSSSSSLAKGSKKRGASKTDGSLLDSLKGMISSILSRFASSFA